MSPSKGISGFDANTSDPAPKQRRNLLLLIGIDQYEHWSRLQYPVKDCSQFFELLKEHYGFQEQGLIQSLYNEQATADIIYDELYRLQELDENGDPHLGTDDNLILYFSGHGHLDKSLDEGYWVPIEAPVPVKNRPSDLRKLVSVSEVVKILSQVKAHHIVLIVDACFSGAFSRMAVEVMPGGDPNNPEENPSRWVLTAGRLETVLDNSLFAEALRSELSENARPRLYIQTLGAAIKEKVAANGKQTPGCFSLVEQKQEGGEFFFHRLTAAAQRTDQASRPIATIADLPWRLRQGSVAHLERLKKGRFKHLNIIQLLLTGHNLPDLIDTQVKSGDAETPLQLAVESLWGKEKPHAVVLGEGGMGKTVSLVRLWEDLLKQLAVGSWQLAVPVFVALNEYNAVPESEKHDFVLRSIARNCGLAEALTDDWKNALWELLKTPLPDDSPSVLLMLDGFNEVTVKKDQLLIDLNRLSEQAKGMQMVITSRYVEIQNFTWAQLSEVIELLPLPSEKIEEYLQQVNLPLPEDEALQKLFGNPMMLTLYAGASSIAKKYEHDKRFRFLPTGSYGELLWNFNEAQLARHLEDLEHDPDEQAWHCFLLRCLVPRLAYKMELEGQFFVPTRKALNPAFNFKTLLDDAFADLNREELTEVFPELEGKRSLLGLGELADLDKREQRSQKVLKYLVDKLHLLVPEDEALRFVHQNFRDFFAAVHLRNVAEMALVRGELPEEWKVRAFPVYLRRMLGEIEEQTHFDPKKAATGEPIPGFVDKSTLGRLLDACRDVFKNEMVRYMVWNLVKTCADTRHTLAGMNLERLDLCKVYFNDIPLSHHLGNYRYHTARLKGSLLHGEQLFANGHFKTVRSVCYSPDGKKILSGSSDNTLKVWSAEGSGCLKSFIGHSESVNSACYSPDGEKILSGSSDGTLKEWSVRTGECLRTFVGHENQIWSVCYSPNGRKVLSGSDDQTLKEWLVESGECIQTFDGHDRIVNCVCYSSDGKKVLSCSDDQTLKEWSVESGVCLQIFTGHRGWIHDVCYSPDGKKMLSCSGDHTIKEWSVESGECLQTFTGHSYSVNSICYSSDGKRILSGSDDNTIKEWSVESGKCLQTFIGHTNSVISACYSPSGKQILSGSGDKTIREWLLATGECLQIFKGIEHEITNATYSPDGKKISFSSWDKAIKEWSVNTGKCLQIISGNASAPLSVNYSPDGRKIISGWVDKTVKEWSVAKGDCIRIYKGHNKGVRCVCYDLKGQKILSGSDDTSIKEWIVGENKCRQTFEGHTSSVRSVCYSPDESKVLSGSLDDTIKEWLIVNGKCVRTIDGDSGRIFSVVYSQDGKSIFSGSQRNMIKEWSVESGRLLNTRMGDWSVILPRHLHPVDKKRITYSENKLMEVTIDGEVLNTWFNIPGLYILHCNFTSLHEESQITEEEKDRLRRYGAIFNDEDERRWKEAVADAYGDLDDDNSEKPPQS